MNTSFTPQPGFITTHWSQVALAAGPREVAANNDALGRLWAAYRWPLEVFLARYYRMDPKTAEEFVQEFFRSKVLKGNLLSKARKERGRFRTFLLTAFRNFISDEFTKMTGPTRTPRGGFVHGVDSGAAVDVTAHEDSMANLSADWAREVLGTAVDRMRAECAEAGRLDVFRVFEAKLWRPVLLGGPEVSRPALARELRVTPKQLDSLQTTAKRTFRKAVRNIIGQYARGDEQAELRHLIDALAKSAGRRK